MESPPFETGHREQMMNSAVVTHIQVDDHGVAWIDNTNVKVIEVVLDKLAHGASAEEMHFQYPHLSLAQIYAALAFYHDHQPDMDGEIDRRLAEVEQWASKQSQSPFRERLQGLEMRE
jgi:uncharacterized protein (DUF433 family)